jgi:hypothetical protein
MEARARLLAQEPDAEIVGVEEERILLAFDAGETLPEKLSDHEKRMTAARARAQWELGDSHWAGVIVGAYLHPDEDAEALRREMAE